MKPWTQTFGLYDLKADERHALEACFNPTYTFTKPSFKPSRHRTKHAVTQALTVFSWMRLGDIAAVWLESEDATLRKRLQDTVDSHHIAKPPYAVDETFDCLLVEKIHTFWDELKALSTEGSIFIYTPFMTQVMSFGDIVSEEIPPRTSDSYMLSRLFLTGYEAWFLAAILDQLTKPQQTWILDHLESPFVESLNVDTVVMSSSIKSMIMYVEDFTDVIKKLFKHAFMEELQIYSFGFVYHFMFHH